MNKRTFEQFWADPVTLKLFDRIAADQAQAAVQVGWQREKQREAEKILRHCFVSGLYSTFDLERT